jgi:hypothetical protein
MHALDAITSGSYSQGDMVRKRMRGEHGDHLDPFWARNLRSRV